MQHTPLDVQTLADSMRHPGNRTVVHARRLDCGAVNMGRKYQPRAEPDHRR